MKTVPAPAVAAGTPMDRPSVRFTILDMNGARELELARRICNRHGMVNLERTSLIQNRFLLPEIGGEMPFPIIR